MAPALGNQVTVRPEQSILRKGLALHSKMEELMGGPQATTLPAAACSQTASLQQGGIYSHSQDSPVPHPETVLPRGVERRPGFDFILVFPESVPQACMVLLREILLPYSPHVRRDHCSKFINERTGPLGANNLRPPN